MEAGLRLWGHCSWKRRLVDWMSARRKMVDLWHKWCSCMFNFHSIPAPREESLHLFQLCFMESKTSSTPKWTNADVVTYWSNTSSRPLPPPHSARAELLSSPPLPVSSSSFSSFPPSFRLSDLSCGSRGLICSPNTRNCTRAKGARTLTHSQTHFFTTSRAVRVLRAAFRFKTRAAAAHLPQIPAWAHFNAPLGSTLSQFPWRCSFQWGFIKRLAAINHLLLITN